MERARRDRREDEAAAMAMGAPHARGFEKTKTGAEEEAESVVHGEEI